MITCSMLCCFALIITCDVGILPPSFFSQYVVLIYDILVFVIYYDSIPT